MVVNLNVFKTIGIFGVIGTQVNSAVHFYAYYK